MLNYIQNCSAEAGGVSPVDLIQFIFTLSLTEPRSIYKLKKQDSSRGLGVNDASILRELSHLGLIEILPGKKSSTRSLKFYVTNLMQNFLIS